MSKIRVQDFLSAMWHGWWTRMSGPLTVPVTALGLWLSNDIAKTAFILIAFVCFWVTAYWLWKPEREKVEKLNHALRPKLRASFDMNNFGCVRPGTEVYQRQTSVFGDNTLTVAGIVPPHTLMPTLRLDDSLFPKPEFFATYYRLQVECEGVESVANCFGRLEHISKDGWQNRNWEPAILPFAASERNDAASKKIHRGSPEYLDVMFIADDNRVGLLPFGFVGSSSVNWLCIFAEPGLYVLRIHILSDTPTIAVDLSFHWTGDRKTSKIKCREAAL
jgi:hypothetical protein